MRKIKISFKRYTDTFFDLLTAFILSCMEGNENFPTPIPTLAAVSESLAIYRNALQEAKTKASLAIARKNEAREALEMLLKALGLYIMAVANGNLVVLASSGYQLTKVPGPRTVSNPGSVFLEKGNSSGEMVASIKPEKPAPGYIFQISSTDPAAGEATVWNSLGSTANKYTFVNLVPGNKYWVRVIAIGARGQMIYSPVFAEFAL